MPLFQHLSLDTASEFIFGNSMDDLCSPDSHKEFLDAYFYVQRGTAVRLMLSFIDKHVDDALMRREKGDITGAKEQIRLIDKMVKATQDRLTLRFQMRDFFTPAHDDPAIALSNAFFHPCQSPKT
ncbi:hypothetical protein BKA65DRAFT_510579 [Rhexocercosporidium sp. MPI-PUGE-AT-0058]|nr:hypothetical protein BKA65DRAFT_510579 [Rhexocercosporidium sp. MPI-PUGE-AT-0058]